MLNLLSYIVDTTRLLEKTTVLKPINLYIQTNAICSYLQGISNTFGSELWLCDFLFQIALGNVKKSYIEMDTLNNAYSVMAFTYATRNNCVFYNSTINYGSSIQPNIPVYITKNVNEYFITVINKDDGEENVEVNVSVPLYTKAELIRFICNQTINGVQGMSFGELTFDNSTGLPIHTTTKDDTNTFTLIDISSNNGIYTFIADKSSVCILRIPLSTGGAYFNNINNSDEKNTIITIDPNPRDGDSVPTTMTLPQFEQFRTEL